MAKQPTPKKKPQMIAVKDAKAKAVNATAYMQGKMKSATRLSDKAKWSSNPAEKKTLDSLSNVYRKSAASAGDTANKYNAILSAHEKRKKIVASKKK